MVTTRYRLLLLIMGVWLVTLLALLALQRQGSAVAGSLLPWLFPLGALCLILVFARR